MVKSKVRFDGLDVAAMVAHWNRVALGRRVINIYNGANGDTYMFKLDKQSGEAMNMMLMLESGIRFHTTMEAYENPGMPSMFCAKLRKHLRGLRLENVQQLGKKDRVVMLTFGSGEAQRHSLILEFYARGNVILTNSNFVILALLRSHDYDGAVKVQVGHAYPITYATTMDAPDQEGNEVQYATSFIESENPLEWYQTHRPVSPDGAESGNKGKKKKGGAADEWRGLLLKPASGVGHYSPSLIEHCLLCADINPKEKPPSFLTDADWRRLQEILRSEGGRILADMELADAKGYIFYQPKLASDDGEKDNAGQKSLPATPFDEKLLLEFQPHVLKQHEGMPKIEFESFDRAVDAFFAQIEGQKRVLRAETQQAQAEQRLEKAKKEQEQRIQQLFEQQELLKEQAQLVETHADMVDKAIQVVNSALDSGMDWDQLEDLVHVEKTQNQNPVALLIKRLDLEHDAMVLSLEKVDHVAESEGDEGDESARTMDVTINLNDTAFGNASAMFAKYRASKEKSQKTIEATSKVLKAAEESAQRQLQDAQKRKNNVTNTLQTKRKPLWFEKFHWFVTSDNYLVIAGRDAQQNEIVVKRYLRPGDAYLHADVHGAASCVLRAKRCRASDGKTQTLPLSEQALREAGSFTICHSSAWSSRMVTSAWWVESHQVSKSAPTGEYLTVGSFMIRGKKNYLPPSQLEMGLGVLFKLGDEEGIARHKNERRDFALMQLEEQDEETPALESDPVLAKGPAATKAVDAAGQKEPPMASTPSHHSAESPEDFTPDAVGGEDTNDQEKENFDEDFDEEDTNEADLRNGEDAVSVTSSNKSAPQKGLSIKERKLIKKYGSLEAAQAAEEERLKAEESKKPKPRGAKSDNGKKDVVPTRGKKAKMKRTAKKYADQDEEDRELALLALHAGEKDKKEKKSEVVNMSETAKEAAAQTIAILKKDAAVVAEGLNDEVKGLLAKCVFVQTSGPDEPPVVRWDKFDADVLEQLQGMEVVEQQIAAARRLLVLKTGTRIDNFSASLAGIIRTIRKYGHEGLEVEAPSSSGGKEARRKTKAEKESEQENWKQTLAEEGLVDGELEDDAVDDTVELAKLTGKPHPDDLLLFAVPVCAPYQTLSQYLYRVKLTPGNMKRGKASKACMDIFMKEGQKSAFSDRNKELIKKVADTEWVHAMTGDVKLSAAGANKTTQKQKGKNKPKKKG